MTEANSEGVRGPLGLRILLRRTALGLTQAKAAELAGVNVDTFSDLENGRCQPRALTLAAIARALDLDAGELQRLADAEPAKASS